MESVLRGLPDADYIAVLGELESDVAAKIDAYDEEHPDEG
jgi:hypothetical protein